MARSIKVYTTSTCPYCTMLKDFLKEKGVEFVNYDVGGDNEKLKEMREKSGQFGVPVIDIDGRMIVGFDKEEIEKALE
jgi:glutaredoxin 3